MNWKVKLNISDENKSKKDIFDRNDDAAKIYHQSVVKYYSMSL